MNVPRYATPVPLAGLPEAIDAAHRQLRGISLGDDAYRLVVAQLRLEHGVAGGNLRGIYCYNFGNHDATRSERLDLAVPIFATVPEYEEDKHGRGYNVVHMRRAYDDVNDGLVGYWRALLDGYQDAYEALESETVDTDAFAASLKAGGYYTASEVVYANDLRAIVPALPE